MPQRLTTVRLVMPIVLVSTLLLGLCGFMAVYLFRLQSHTAEELGENVSSRRAAFDLEYALNSLVDDYADQAHTVKWRSKISGLIEEVVRFADKENEHKLALQAREGFQSYMSMVANMPAADDPNYAEAENAALAVLERRVIRPTKALRAFNAEQIEKSEQAVRRSLRYAAWGLGLVGLIGSVGGLIMGYAVARSMRQTIHRLQVQVRDAADKLGQDLATVVIAGGDLNQLDEQVGGVVRQVEQVVQRLQQREREVLRAEQLAAVGQLAAGVAHEIRNPLTSIKLLVEMAREEAEVKSNPTDDLVVIENEIRRMEQSLNSFLAFARPPRLEKSPQEMADLLDQTLSLVQGRATRQNVAIEFERPKMAIVVEADGGQLQQVFVNLALNSLEAMPSGGRLTVSLKAPTNGTVELELSDTGTGIAPEMWPRLFEPFASDKETGLGLGLVISKRIIEDHGGTIQAAAPNRLGASFVVRLPAKAG